MAKVDGCVVRHVVPVEGIASVVVFAEVICSLHHRVRCWADQRRLQRVEASQLVLILVRLAGALPKQVVLLVSHEELIRLVRHRSLLVRGRVAEEGGGWELEVSLHEWLLHLSRVLKRCLIHILVPKSIVAFIEEERVADRVKDIVDWLVGYAWHVLELVCHVDVSIIHGCCLTDILR